MANNSSVLPSDPLAAAAAAAAVRVGLPDSSQSPTSSRNAADGTTTALDGDAHVVDAAVGEDTAMEGSGATGGDAYAGAQEHTGDGNSHGEEDDEEDEEEDEEEEDEDDDETAAHDGAGKHLQQNMTDAPSTDNGKSNESGTVANVDAELEAMKKRLQQMEEETYGMQGNPKECKDDKKPESTPVPQNQSATNGTAVATDNDPNTEVGTAPSPNEATEDGTSESDARSIYVGNVDYKATGEELNQFFKECGTINRVTIMCHKATGQPKGYAYIEFKEREAVQNALILNESLFLGRPIKVVEKRTNIPAVHRGGYRGRAARYIRGWRGSHGRRPRGRGRGRGRWAPY